MVGTCNLFHVIMEGTCGVQVAGRMPCVCLCLCLCVCGQVGVCLGVDMGVPRMHLPVHTPFINP